jgi:hypothetical protein
MKIMLMARPGTNMMPEGSLVGSSMLYSKEEHQHCIWHSITGI